MWLALRLAGINAIITIIVAVVTWPAPLEGIQWIRAIDCLIFWRASDMAQPAVHIVLLFNSHPTLSQVAHVGVFLYVISFLLAGSAQWFVIGLLIDRLMRATSTNPLKSL